MDTLLEQLARTHNQLSFRAGTAFYWSPETSEIFYKSGGTDSPDPSPPTDSWSLLHETSHALLGHKRYQADLELLHLEVEAWRHAQSLGKRYGIVIDDDYIQDCLDTYRDWLYRRSLCPSCGTQCLQADHSSHYTCFNCHARWHVSPSRFCRPYRRSHAVHNL